MDDLAPVIVSVFLFMIPIIAILTAHQRKMAEIIHSRKQSAPETELLRSEIRELKQLMHQQAIALDDLRGTPRSMLPPTEPAEVRERLGGGA